MALIKQKRIEKERYVKKEIKLKQSTWSKVTAYAKYAGIKGQAGEKRDFILESALEYLFKNDKGFAEFLAANSETAATIVKEPEVTAPKNK